MNNQAKQSLCTLSFCAFCISGAFANPLGGVVGSGAAVITPAGSLLTISQSSDRAVINWGSFNIANGETTVFQFNGAAGVNSAVLNRVTGATTPSTIAGMLHSTVGPGGPQGGTVLVLNPAGVLFTPTATVSVGSLIASTLNVSDGEFLANSTLHFSGTSTLGVQNHGSLSAVGDIFLIAHTVQNSGNITAGGAVGLAAGTTVTLAQSGSERLSVVAGTGTGTAIGVDNTAAGQINAVTAELKAAGGNIYALAINNGGVVRANTVTREGGHIFLRAGGGNIQNSGTLSADNANGAGGTITVDGGHNAADPSTVISSGTIEARGNGTHAQGGTVEVLGDNVGLVGSALVDVSGDGGGGTALIGGDLRGANPNVQNAEQVFVGSRARIEANATVSGNGGKVVVWSDDSTRFYGSVNAGGGPSRGNGGFIEISGRSYLDFQGSASTLAPHGLAGTLLLDPTDLTIDNGASDPNTTGDGSIGTPFTPLAGVPPAAASHLRWSTIKGSLAGGNVLVTTVGSPASAGEAGDILVAADSPDLTSANQLTLQAKGMISLGGGILNSTAGGSLVLEAQGATAGTAITQTAGTIQVASLTIKAPTGSVTLNQANQVNNLTIASAGGAFQFTDASSLSLQGISAAGQTVSLTANGAGQTLTEPSGVITAGTLALSGWGATSLNQNNTVDVLTVSSAGGPVSITDAANLDVQNLSASGQTVTLTAGTGGPFTLGESAGTITAGTLSVNGWDTITLPATAVTALNIEVGAGGFNINNSGSTLTSLNIISDTGTAAAETLTSSGLTFNVAEAGGNTTINNVSQSGLNFSYQNKAGNITATTITTTGGSDAAGGNVTLLVGSGQTLTATGTIDAEGGADAAGTGGHSGGSVSLTGGTVSVATINTSGSAAKAGSGASGGSAGAITLDGTGGTPTITLAGDQTATGGAGDGAGVQGNGGTVEYKSAVVLAGTVTVDASGAAASGSVSFDSTVDGTVAGAQGLTVNATTTTFNDKVGQGTALVSLTTDAAGTTTLKDNVNATTVDFKDAVTLAGSVTVQNDNSGASATSVNFEQTVDGAHALTVDATTTTFGGQVGGTTPLASLTTDAAGTTTINGGRVNANAQDYKDNVTLGADTILAKNNANNSATSVNIEQTVDGAHALTVDATTTTFGGQVGGTTPLTSLTTDAAGTTAINGGRVNADAQDYKDNVTLGADTVLAKNNANNSASSVNLEQRVDGAHALTVDATTTTFGGQVGGTTPLTSLTTDAAGTTAINGGRVNADVQDYKDVVTLGADAILAKNNANNSATSVTFEQTVDGAQDLTVDATTTTFSGQVGGTTPLTSLTTDAAGTTAINGGRVNANAQDYKDNVTLGADTVLAKNNANNSASSVNLEQAVDGAHALTVDATTTTFGGQVGGTTPLTSLTTDAAGTTAINGGRVNADAQDYKDNVTLGADTVLAKNNANNSATSVNFEQTLDGADALTVDATTTTFGDKVGGTTPLTGLTTDAAGTTAINGGRVNADNQDYKDTVTLGADTVLAKNNANNSATSVNIEQTVDGAHALTVDATTTTFGGQVGGTTPLTSLTTDAAGTTAINGGRVNANAQDYKDNVTIGADTIVANNNANNPAASVNFEQSVDGAHALTVDATTTTFGGQVGGATALTSLTTDAAGTTAINGGRVNADLQDYKDVVTIGADTVVAKNNANNSATSVNFEQTVDGAHALTVDATATTFAGQVGGTTPLTGLTTDAAGTTAINGGRVNATAQDYQDAVTLGADTILAKNNANNSATSVNVEQTVDGAHALTVDATTTTFGGQVGGTTPLTSLTTDASGTTAINGGRVNADLQDYKDNVTIGADTTLARNNANNPATSVNFEQTLDGAHALTVDATTTTFGDKVGGVTPLTSLTTDAAGTTAINGGRVNADNQDYKDTVTLGADTTLAKNNANNPAASVNFEQTVDGAHALTVDATATTFGGQVGGATPLTSLTTDAAGATSLVGATTTGAQNYNDGTVNLSGTYAASTFNVANATVLSGDTTVGAGTIGFGGTVNGAHTLVANSSGATTFAGQIGNTDPLTGLTTDAAGTTEFDGSVNVAGPVAINDSVNFNVAGSTAANPTVLSSGGQTYGGTVTLSQDTVFADNGSQTITFNSTINNGAGGPHSLEVNTLGDEVFNGLVGSTPSPLASVTTDDPASPQTPTAGGSAIFSVHGSLASPNVATVGAQTYHDLVFLENDAVLATVGTGGITLPGGLTDNGHTLTTVFNEVAFIPTTFSDTDAKRILTSISPRVKKGQAKPAAGSSGKALDYPALVPVERSYGEHFNNQL